MATQITKGMVSKNDLSLYAGAASTFNRKTSTGGTKSLNRFDWVGIDVYQIYGETYGRTSAAIKAAAAQVAASTTTKLFLGVGTWTVSTSITIPSNIALEVNDGAILSISSGKTLTINGPLYAGPYQIFSGSGTIAGDMIVDAVIPEWWGAVGDGTTDDYAAVNNALTYWFQRTIPGRFVFLSGKDYLINTAIAKTFDSAEIGPWSLEGHGSQLTSGISSGTLLTLTSNTSSGNVRNLHILGMTFEDGGNSDGLLTLNGGDGATNFMPNFSLRDCRFESVTETALSLLGNFFESNLNNCHFRCASSTTGYAIYCYNGTGSGTVSSVSINDCVTVGGKNGIYIKSPTGDVKVVGCTCRDAQEYGVVLENNYGNTIMNNHLENNWKSAATSSDTEYQSGIYLVGDGVVMGNYGTSNDKQNSLVRIYAGNVRDITVIGGNMGGILTHYAYVEGTDSGVVRFIGDQIYRSADDPVCSISRQMTYKDFEVKSTSGAGEDTLGTYTIQEDMFGPQGAIRVTAFGNKTNGNTENKTLKFYFGAKSVTFHAAAANANDWRFEGIVMNYRDDTNQTISWKGYDGTTLLQGSDGATEDTTGGDITVKITGECATGTDVINQQGFIVEFL